MTIAPSAKEIQKQIKAKQMAEETQTKVKTVSRVEMKTANRVQINSKEFKNFVDAAPDGANSTKKVCHCRMKGNKAVITHTIDPELLLQVEAVAETMGIKRATVINLMIKKVLATGLLEKEW